ncbi:Ribosomal large subunit pseudouridine synthase A [Pseudobythopirellula maris]|uniref:Ribosomal large subunit pseudouridine synthase A n=1 Tax=Pseudobythopirellula maris TaxID=2527991 RepID=A0A5C5ZUV7_9BACT|nr:RluA family pseudouridine synthase [Pseudobythopirellula maris]TWT90023.1 Ribosomal large subunit pseudouridine synthase A [Pseudobythopirellula maris]
MRVLYEDNHLLAIAKPAGLPTMGAGPDVTTLLDEAKEYVRVKHNKPGNVYLGIVSRLDAPVTGVVLMARTSKAAARLSAAFRERRVEKRYLALVCPSPEEPEATLVHALRKDERNRRVHVTAETTPDAQRAELSYRTVHDRGDRALLEVRPITGRKHQIRVQLAKIGAPIVGDRKYGSQEALAEGVALHAWRLVVEHPVRREPIEFVCPPPKGWAKAYGAALAGALAGLD